MSPRDGHAPPGAVRVELPRGASDWGGWHLTVGGRPVPFGEPVAVPPGPVDLDIGFAGRWRGASVDAHLTTELEVSAGAHVTVSVPLDAVAQAAAQATGMAAGVPVG